MQKIIETLHPLERAVLPILKQDISFNEIIEKTKLKEVEVMRALQWLENKDLIKIKKDYKEVIKLDKNGEKYINEGLPEKRFLRVIFEKDLNIDEIKEEADLDENEFSISLGLLKKSKAVKLNGKIKITELGKKIYDNNKVENFLKNLPLNLNELSKEEREIYNYLRKRKRIIKAELRKIIKVELTDLGEKLSKEKIRSDLIDSLTQKILKDKAWKGKKFRRYDVKINVPKIYPAKKQIYRAFLDEVRKKFLALGFTEMTGPIVETDFWDMDVLFMPQFHSARDIHNAFYIKEPKYGKLNEVLVKKIKQAHENGFKTGSKGWRYNFDVKRTHRLLLRTQGTALSARTLANKPKIPGKYFAIARCFRYDVIDATHGVDFYQTEGIVVEDGLNFKHLKGLLKLFAKEFAETDKIKITPAYFPFTEPSATLYAKHPEIGWIELAGSGIFRPEMCKPLGINVPVLAWGIGIDRIAMFKLKINDIRELFSHNLEFLRCQQ